MSARVKSDTAAMIDDATKRDFVLAAIRKARDHAKLLQRELEMCGVALAGGHVSSDVALEWAEELAPGCLGYIPASVRMVKS
jgi:hypothetical protein